VSHGEPLEHLKLAVGGLDFHAVATGPAGGRLVLLLHGFPEFSYGWREQMAPLAAAGFRVVAPDQRGYGRSAKPEGVEQYGLDLLAADVAGIAEACGAASFDLVGHDWGGIVAWWAAVRYPERVRRLVVINAPHPVAARRYIKRHWRQLLRSWYIGFFQLRGIPEWLLRLGNFALLAGAMKISAPRGLFTSDELQAYRQAWSRPGALTAMLNWYRALPLFRRRRIDPTVHQPTLILWGDADPFLSVGLAEASLRYCEAAKLIRVEGASHWLQHEGPELVAEEICAFFADSTGDAVEEKA
jgi:pimeloyl-ACP methyl ester carboxylesterase